MKITVKAKPGAKEERLENLGDNSYGVRVKEKPAGGKANEAVRNLLAEHFGVSKSRVVLLKGASSRQKVFEILL